MCPIESNKISILISSFSFCFENLLITLKLESMYLLLRILTTLAKAVLFLPHFIIDLKADFFDEF